MRNAILCAAAVAALSTSICFAGDGSDPALTGGGQTKVEAVDPPSDVLALPAVLATWSEADHATFNGWFDALPDEDATPYKLGEGALVEAFTARKEAKAAATEKAKPPAEKAKARPAKAEKAAEAFVVWVAPGYAAFGIGKVYKTDEATAAALQASAKARPASPAEVKAAGADVTDLG